jgi:uncharacterized membrane protein YkvI
MFNSRLFRIYIVPGAVFQSVIVAGGYGTGREVVEYLTRFGPLGGLQAMAISAIVFGLVIALSYEFARSFRVYDYRNFFKVLLGRFWFAYEFIFIITIFPVMAVMTAASGEVLEGSFGVSRYVGIGIMLVAIVTLNFYGRELVKKSLTLWAMLVMTVLLVFCALIFRLDHQVILAQFQTGEVLSGWGVSGLKFAVYNMVSIPVLLYSITAIETRREALSAGAIAGFLAIIPALFFHITFLSRYPEVVSETLPTYWVLQDVGFPILTSVYVLILFGTIVQTGVGVLQGLNERLDASFYEYRGRKLGRGTHACIAVFTILASALLSKIGIITLVSRGYTFIAWSLFLVFVVPLLSIGIYKIITANRSAASNN